MYRPMKGDQVSVEQVKLPAYVQPKYDGFRCLIDKDGYWSSSGKPIRNDRITELGIHKLAKEHDLILDGELIVTKGQGYDLFEKTASTVTKRGADVSNVMFIWFDIKGSGMFEARHMHRRKIYMDIWQDEVYYKHLSFCPTFMVHNGNDLIRRYISCLDAGFEGLIVRSPTGEYKKGRATVKGGELLKMKPSLSTEAEIIGIVEEVDKVGLTKGSLGSYTCRLPDGKIFNVGTGFTHYDREVLFDDQYIGKMIEVNYQSLTADGIPRFPVFKKFRDVEDLTEY